MTWWGWLIVAAGFVAGAALGFGFAAWLIGKQMQDDLMQRGQRAAGNGAH